ncbi:transglutaminase domain protein [Geobacter metallireducens RCH3]|uniref:Transglutaminase domain protein n=1 Tax=Geobacter metallireducens (strain ATCC 53774 / DSM 7210 / GS-15) TaxID=269799 RepID=Q39ZM2_GEOMG|nr:transglutaminase domain-containing protein [Geobacter metallireducens]ABB30302.1 transglutaminase domain protein [Geobacter metallireducens GS-15]EHP84895.1 transglutaminase domain protein [Geobacter metallireducens RCH3]
MRLIHLYSQSLGILIFVLVTALSVNAETKASTLLQKPPVGERWFGIFLGNERTGFAHQNITAKDGGYEITVEGSVKMVVMGFSREASSRERYIVGTDLSLRSFAVEQVIDGTPMGVTGEATPKGVRVVVNAGGERKEKLLTAKGPVFPPPVLNILPLMKGTAKGKRLQVQMLDVEAVKVKKVTVTVVGFEPLPDGARALHIRNDLFPLVDNDIWVDAAGNTIRESVRDGLVETVAEDEGRTRQFIASAALSRRDLIFDFSLVRVDPPLANATSLSRLVLEIDGVPATMPLIQGGGQTARRTGAGTVVFTVEPAKAGASPLDEPERKRFSEPADRLPADHPDIIARAREVVGEETAPLKQVERLVKWVATTVEDAVTDAPSPLDTLKSRKGNCQSHARLYATLARAAGIPTRFVSGLVYLEGRGFLYHSWAESYVKGGWLQVDPTFGQVPVDATHVKLVEGEGPDDLAAIAGVVGKIKARVIEAK